MTDEERRQHFAEARVARLATVTADGAPNVVPCCFVLHGDTVYSAIDAKPKSTLQLQRLVNIGANNRVSLIVDAYDEDWTQLWWVRADGVARVVESGTERQAAADLLRNKYEQYQRVAIEGAVIAIEVTKWRSWSYT